MLWPLISYLFILAVHYVADWLAQTSWMARNKSHSNLALNVHVAVYTLILAVGCAWWFESAAGGVVFAAVNGVLHWFVDAITSKVTAWAHERKHHRTFFNVIGFDQLLHQLSLGGTLIVLIRAL